ncbi:MAG: arsenate reductase ArsC [bacterium]|nr:arsenate reductase ArsC [bacterium]
MKILVLCTGNSCRSQMMHGWLVHFGGPQVQVRSAGIATHGVNPTAIKVMAETDVDISTHTSNHIDEYLGEEFDLILTVCDHARESCPVFPSSSEQIHHNFSDPAKAEGTEEEVLAAFRSVRDEIKEFSKKLLSDRLV